MPKKKKNRPEEEFEINPWGDNPIRNRNKLPKAAIGICPICRHSNLERTAEKTLVCGFCGEKFAEQPPTC